MIFNLAQRLNFSRGEGDLQKLLGRDPKAKVVSILGAKTSGIRRQLGKWANG